MDRIIRLILNLMNQDQLISKLSNTSPIRNAARYVAYLVQKYDLQSGKFLEKMNKQAIEDIIKKMKEKK